MSVRDAVVVVTGATGPAGRATCAALSAAGATVIALGRDRGRLDAEFGEMAGVVGEVADLSSQSDVTDLATRIRAAHGSIDGLIHLVGGWRGGPRFTANTDDDWAVMSAGLDGLRHITIALHDDLVASPRGRVAIVSATAVDSPTPGGASYAAVKAAAEMWIRAMAESLRRGQSGRKLDPVPQHSAAVILVIKALVDAPMRAADPEKTFAGFTETTDLADRVVGLFAEDAGGINGARILL